MIRDIRMGFWTGLLGGVVTGVIAALLDLAGGGGLDVASEAGSVGGASGLAAALVALLVLVPGLSIVLGLVLALLPPRTAGAGAGLALGAGAGVVAALVEGGGRLAADWPVILGCALGAGLVTGFLYSRYARTRLRAASPRPFVRRP